MTVATCLLLNLLVKGYVLLLFEIFCFLTVDNKTLHFKIVSDTHEILWIKEMENSI